MISPAVLDQIRAATDLPSLIREYGVDLKPVSGGMLALCPFHSEDTASFRVHTVGERKNLYKCFGCDAKGGPVDFLMAIERMPFLEAVSLLADRAGISLTPDRRSRIQQAADAENIPMSHWWWTRRRDWSRGALDAAIRDMDALDSDPVAWKEALEHVYVCGRLLRKVEAVPAAERLTQFRRHVTHEERKEWRREVEWEKWFTEAWMAVGEKAA